MKLLLLLLLDLVAIPYSLPWPIFPESLGVPKERGYARTMLRLACSNGDAAVAVAVDGQEVGTAKLVGPPLCGLFLDEDGIAATLRASLAARSAGRRFPPPLPLLPLSLSPRPRPCQQPVRGDGSSWTLWYCWPLCTRRTPSHPSCAHQWCGCPTTRTNRGEFGAGGCGNARRQGAKAAPVAEEVAGRTRVRSRDPPGATAQARVHLVRKEIVGDRILGGLHCLFLFY